MAILKLKIVSGRPKLELQKFQTAKGKHSTVQSVVNFLDSLQTGTELAMAAGSPPSVNILVQEAEVAASGTFTLTSVIATDAVKVNGVTFTCVASGATANQFNVGLTDTLTAVNLAASINASVTALVAGYVTATSALTVVTITSAFYGLSGNQTLIESLDGTVVASGALLTGGAVDAGSLTVSF